MPWLVTTHDIKALLKWFIYIPYVLIKDYLFAYALMKP
jgi:hypothetical protein